MQARIQRGAHPREKSAYTTDVYFGAVFRPNTPNFCGSLRSPVSFQSFSSILSLAKYGKFSERGVYWRMGMIDTDEEKFCNSLFCRPMYPKPQYQQYCIVIVKQKTNSLGGANFFILPPEQKYLGPAL